MHKLVSSTLVALCATVLLPHPAGAQGQAFYESRCVLCHGADGTGSDRAGSILARAATLSTDRLAAIITVGVPARGMPRGSGSASATPTFRIVHPGRWHEPRRHDA